MEENKEKKETTYAAWKENKYGSAIGAFWGASLFLGALLAVILIFVGIGWLFSVIIGALTFLTCGLLVQGIVTLFKKEN